MPREHARIKLSIWDDDDFRALSPAAQHLYFVLTIHPKLDYCGVTDWRPSRLAGFCGPWTGNDVEIAGQELAEGLFIIVDTETEEVLLRSFVRNDGFMDQPNMATAMAKAHRSISSAPLRGIVIHELRRLHKDKPDLKGWAKVSELLDRPSFDPSEYPSFQASAQPSDEPSGWGHPNPSRNPSGQPSPTTAPNSQLLTPNSTTEDQDFRENHYETLPARDATPPTCARHPNGDHPGDCGGCRRVRIWHERNDQHTTAQAARTRERDHSDALLEDIRRARNEAVPRPQDTR